MKSKKYLLMLLILQATLFISCKSIDVKKENIYIMVYDYLNNAVQDVSFYIDGEIVGKSDVYGRFVFSIPYFKGEPEHLMRLEKNGYNTIEDVISYKDGLVLYYKIGTATQFLAKAENELDNNNLSLALEYINLSLEIQNRDDSLYLKSIILEKQGKINDAQSTFNLIINKEYIKKYPIIISTEQEPNQDE